MAEGDYTIPTFPGVVGLGGGGGYHHHARGLEGKDASLIHSLHDLDGKRDLTEAVCKNSKEDALNTVEVKFELAKDIKSTEIRAERIAREHVEQMHHVRRDLEKEVNRDGDKTRDLIRAMDEQRRRDARDAAVDAALVAINAKLDILLP